MLDASTRKPRGRALAYGVASVALLGLALPSLAVDDQTVQTQTKRRGYKGNQVGSYVTTTTETYRWVSDVRNVVALYRDAHKSWLGDLLDGTRTSSPAWTYGGADVNGNLVSQVASQVGWENLLWYVWKNVGQKANQWKNQGAADLKGDSGYSLQQLKNEVAGAGVGNFSWGMSDGILLIDTEKTGLDAIVGIIPVEQPGEGEGVWSNGFSSVVYGLGQKTVKLRGGEEVSVDIKGYTYTVSPIILDLAGTGRPDLLAGGDWRLASGRRLAGAALRPFDLDGTRNVAWEWVGPGSGLLVWDPEHKGKITSGKQLFGNVTWGKRWRDGYQALATLDKNRDGRLAGKELEPLAVWRDLDSNAAATPGEVVTLSSLGIQALGVRPQRDARGNAWTPRGVERLLPGRTAPVAQASWDWIAMGASRTAGGSYVWMGKVADRKVGGYLHLRNDGGLVRGFSIPTVGNDPLPGGLLPAIPVKGKVTPRFVRWWTPAPDGSKVESEVLVQSGGKWLSGRTFVTTPSERYSYDWQAQLVAGQPLGRMAAAVY